MLILTAVRSTGQPRVIFVTISIMILLAYVIKPYTYDLTKYSIFFNTGFIQSQPWHSPDDVFILDYRDTTGEPFDQAFEPGFRWLAKIGNVILPTGSLVPRIDAEFGDFKERGPPRSDAMIFLIMGFGFFMLLISVRSIGFREDYRKHFRSIDLVLAAPLILGSIFFILGSQNVLRQFLGVAIIILAMSSMVSKRYFLCATLVVLSGAFHQWAPILGLIGIYLITLGGLGASNELDKEVKPFSVSGPEGIALISGIIIVALIKGIMVIGIFNMEIPLLGDLKPYVIKGQQYLIAERSGSLIKVGVIVGLFLISEGLIGKTKEVKSTFSATRLLRRRTIALILPLAVYPEIFSRLLVFYWAVEMIFIVWALNSSEPRVRLGGVVVFVAYGFSPNVINTLVGPKWLYNFLAVS
jgi:hypothetical protein